MLLHRAPRRRHRPPLKRPPAGPPQPPQLDAAVVAPAGQQSGVGRVPGYAVHIRRVGLPDAAHLVPVPRAPFVIGACVIGGGGAAAAKVLLSKDPNAVGAVACCFGFGCLVGRFRSAGHRNELQLSSLLATCSTTKDSNSTSDQDKENAPAASSPSADQLQL
jgi:hypothetical protein